MELTEYLKQYEASVTDHLLHHLTAQGLLGGCLLTTDDFYAVWDKVAPSYISDSVKEIAQYPTVALGWAMYLGMAVAMFWDDEWNIYSRIPNLYEYIRDKRGYDYMDEVVRTDILCLNETDFNRYEQLVQDCAGQVLSRIRHEQIEPQSPTAYHVYASSVKVLFHLGASVVLYRLGYKLEGE